MFKKIKFFVFLSFFLFFFFYSCIPFDAPALAQTVDYSSGRVISGQIHNAKGKTYGKKVLVELRSVSDDSLKAIYITSRGSFNFDNVDVGSYQVRVFFYKDLFNADIDPTPIYTEDVTISNNTSRFTLGRHYLALPIKCSKGSFFYYNNGTPSCGTARLQQPDFDATEIEDIVFAMVNFKRQQKKLMPYERDQVLYDYLKSHVNDMVANGYLGFVDSEGCDRYCRFTANGELSSVPYERIIKGYTYSKFSRKTRRPSRYATPYNFANRLARKVPYKKVMKEYTYFETAIVIRSSTIYVNWGGTIDFSDSEKQGLDNIINDLVAGVSEDRQKIQNIHDWIANNVAYDTRKKGISHTGVAAFRYKKAVCDGYSQLLWYMLKEAGIESEIVIGYAPRAHAWNKVILDGQELYIDATWDAGYTYRRKFHFSYSQNYFLIPENCILVDHYVNKKSRVRKKRNYVQQNANLFMNQCQGLYYKYSS